jgi:hypothetical protein
MRLPLGLRAASATSSVSSILTYITTASSGTNSTSVTFANTSYGGAGLIVISVGGECLSSSGAPDVTSVTLGGNAATRAVQARDTADTDGLAIAALYYINVTSGTSADIVVTTNVALLRRQIGVWRLQNLTSNTPEQTASIATASGSGKSVTLSSITNGSLAVAAYTAGGNSGDITFTGVTENFDAAIAGSTGTRAAGGSVVVSGTSLTVTTSHTNIADGNVLVCANWK